MLIVLGVLIVGIAVVVSLVMFNTHFSEQIKEMAIKQMHEISSKAVTHWQKPQNIGGGGGSYIDFEIPEAIKNNDSNWKYDLRISSFELNFFMISKDLVYNGQPYLLQGLHKNGKLMSIKFFDPQKNLWETLFDNAKEETETVIEQTSKMKNNGEKDSIEKNKRVKNED